MNVYKHDFVVIYKVIVIYQNAYVYTIFVIVLHAMSVFMIVVEADKNNTNIYSPLDVTKYKIQAETSGKMESNTERNVRNQESSDICPRTQTRRNQTVKHKEEIIPDVSRVSSEFATIRKRLPIPKHFRSRSAGNDDRQIRDNNEQLNSDSENVYTFKISSTEDNYVFDKFKAKSKIINENIDDSKTFACNPAWLSNNRTKNENSSEAKSAHVSLPDDTRLHRDFLSRHRSRIAKLKRKFFESNSTPITIPVENISNRDIRKEDDCSTNIEPDTVASIPPPKPPRVSTLCERDNIDSTVSSQNHLKQQITERQRRHSVDGALGRRSFEELQTRWSTTSDQYVVVVAIDFGTTYSGYAYSFNYDPGKYQLIA